MIKYSVRFRDVFRVEECIELIWQDYQKDYRDFKLYSKDQLQSLWRFGSRGMPFTVRRVAYRDNIYRYTRNGIASGKKQKNTCFYLNNHEEYNRKSPSGSLRDVFPSQATN